MKYVNLKKVIRKMCNEWVHMQCDDRGVVDRQRAKYIIYTCQTFLFRSKVDRRTVYWYARRKNGEI